MSDSTEKPEIRGGFAKQTVKMIDLLDDAVKKRIFNQIPQDILKAVSYAKESDWLPLEFDIVMTDRIMTDLGEKEYLKKSIAISKAAIESSLMGPFIRSALYLFKISPKTLLKIAPQIWGTCYRNCGKISVVEKGLYSVQIVLEDLPQEFVASRPYVVTTGAFIRAMDYFTGAKNTKVEIEQQSEMNRRIVFNVSWEAG